MGFTNDYDDSYLLCNLFVGKKVFRNQLGEIMPYCRRRSS